MAAAVAIIKFIRKNIYLLSNYFTDSVYDILPRLGKCLEETLNFSLAWTVDT